MKFTNSIYILFLLSISFFLAILLDPIVIGISASGDPASEDRALNSTNSTNNSQLMIVERAKQVNIVFGAISKGNTSYFPNPVIVDRDYFVTWLNTDSILHTVTSGQGIEDDSKGIEFDSPVLRPGEVYSYKFQTAGEFPYFCLLHPSMIGKAVVSEYKS